MEKVSEKKEQPKSVLLSSRRTISGIGENGSAESGSRAFLYCWHIFFLDTKGDRDNNSPRGIRIKDVPLKSQEFIYKKKKKRIRNINDIRV